MATVSTANPLPYAAQTTANAKFSKAGMWTGRTLSGLASAFLAFDVALKVFEAAPAIQGTTELGYSAHSVFGIGIVELVCLIAYLVPRTRVLGAVLLTGYLGGAVATHVRIGNPLFSHVLFPVYVAALIWGGLYLRDAAVRALLPLSKRS